MRVAATAERFGQFSRGLNAKPKSNAETGRSVFNGKGACSSCHGVDGYLDKRPQLASDTAAFHCSASIRSPPI